MRSARACDARPRCLALATPALAAENALKAEGCRIDDSAWPLGLLVTKTHRLAGTDDAMQALNHRVRLHRTLTTAGMSQTRVQVPREMIRRERILWGERDAGVATADALAQRALDERVLAAIAREL